MLHWLSKLPCVVILLLLFQIKPILEGISVWSRELFVVFVNISILLPLNFRIEYASTSRSSFFWFLRIISSNSWDILLEVDINCYWFDIVKRVFLIEWKVKRILAIKFWN